MLKAISVGIAAALCLSTTPSLAQAPAPAAPAQAQNLDPNEVICEKQKVTGSRLSVKRVCKTRAQWMDQQLQERQEVEKVQTQRGMKSGG